jgi:hypothetical protein
MSSARPFTGFRSMVAPIRSALSALIPMGALATVAYLLLAPIVLFEICGSAVLRPLAPPR